jgi:hypothetical protein
MPINLSNVSLRRAFLRVWNTVMLFSFGMGALAQGHPSLQFPEGEANKTKSDRGSTTVKDQLTQAVLLLPAGWNVSREDGELSTFRLDAITATSRTDMRLVAQLGSNPYPLSTFSGALFYLSLTPHSDASGCKAQAISKPAVPMGTEVIADRSFNHGATMHGTICTEARDSIFTAMHKGSCVRFDLVINSFCGGEVSGAQDMTEAQLADLQRRLHDILQTVRFETR